MGVVAAGMHHADRFAVPGRAHGRGERQIELFGHRQRIHVGAQRDDRAGQPAAQKADHAGVRDAAAHLVEAEMAQMLGDDRRGAVLAVAELRVRMEIAPPRDHLRLERRCRGIDQRGERVRGGGGGVVHRVRLGAGAPIMPVAADATRAAA
jgi:hypothetical protein